MTALPTEPTSPSALHRVHRCTIVITALSVILSLTILLQVLPGTDAAGASLRWASGTPMLFIAAAVASIATVGVLLVRATRHQPR